MSISKKEKILRLWIHLCLILVILFLDVNAKPLDASLFENVAKSGLAIISNMTEMVSNGALISKNMGFELPFAKGNLETQISAGDTMRNNEEARRKRSLNLDTNAPCHIGSADGGGNNIDMEESLRRAYNRLSNAAAKREKKARQNVNKTIKKYFSSTNVNSQSLRRHKRQSELDDLNAHMTSDGKDLSQQAQQVAKKLRNIFENFMDSMNNMTQKLKQYLNGGKNTTNSEGV